MIMGIKVGANKEDIIEDNFGNSGGGEIGNKIRINGGKE